MLKRVVFAMLMLAVVGVLIYLNAWYLKAAVLILACLALNEIYRAFKSKGAKPVMWAGFLTVAASLPVSFFWGIMPCFLLLTAGIVLTLAHLVIAGNPSSDDLLASILPFFYPIAFFIIFFFIIGIETYWIIPITVIILCPVATDTFAYFGGILLGKKKLLPSISPNKTVVGAVSGIIGSVAASALLWLIIPLVWNINEDLLKMLLMGLLCGAFSQLGDLSASYIKRICGVKDFGNLIPGHGGIMDRIDSVIFCVPVAALFYLL